MATMSPSVLMVKFFRQWARWNHSWVWVLYLYSKTIQSKHYPDSDSKTIQSKHYPDSNSKTIQSKHYPDSDSKTIQSKHYPDSDYFGVQVKKTHVRKLYDRMTRMSSELYAIFFFFFQNIFRIWSKKSSLT